VTRKSPRRVTRRLNPAWAPEIAEHIQQVFSAIADAEVAMSNLDEKLKSIDLNALTWDEAFVIRSTRLALVRSYHLMEAADQILGSVKDQALTLQDAEEAAGRKRG